MVSFRRILFTFGIKKFLGINSVPSESDHGSSKNGGLSDRAQNTERRLSRKAGGKVSLSKTIVVILVLYIVTQSLFNVGPIQHSI
jgi:hypothetical protein